jgi:hypothetical protein
MLGIEDRWWIVAFILLLCLIAADIAIPVAALGPWLNMAGRQAEQVDETVQPQTALAAPSTLWPVLVMLGSALLAGLGVVRRFKDEDRHSRWDLLIAAGAANLVIGYVLLRLTVKLATVAAGLG